MFRDRPLTWLFIVATICVDLTLTSSFDTMVPGLVIGQLSAVAIWSVMSKSHRLARPGVFLAVVSLVAGRYMTPASLFFSENFITNFLVAYAILIVIVTLPVALFRYWVLSSMEHKKKKFLFQFQFPLIELFGWTIIVAYASFVSRFLNSESIQQVLTDRYVYLLVPIAVLAAMILEDAAPAKYWIRLVLFLIASSVWILCIAFIPLIASLSDIGELVTLCTVGGVYLFAWSTVRMLDQSRLDMRNRLPQEPQLFNPQD